VSRRPASRLIRMIPALALGAAALVVTAPGASAAGSATTFTLSAGSLTISQPASAAVGSTAVGATTLSGSLGTVSVTDGRGLLTATWTTTVSSTDFTTGAGSASETVTKSNVAYSSGVGTTTGTGVFTPGVVASLAVPGTAGAWVGVGNNTASWNPTVTFTLSPSQVAGTYSGTITHSVT
jgi:hypothetical protein